MSYTNTRKRNSGKIFLTVFVLFVIFMLAFLFTGCATPATATPDPAASQASAPSEEPAAVVDDNYAFGETVTFEDGISLSVSEPSALTVSETAVGQVDGQQTTLFEFVITNNSDENFDPTLVFATASSGGVEAEGVFDSEQGVGFPPTTAVLPGNTIKWQQAFSTADVSSITLEVSVGFDKNVVFTNQ